MRPLPASPRIRAVAIYLVPLSIVLALSWSQLPRPFTGDQALLFYGAKVLDRGGVFYRDFWDNKQPGVFLFYWTAGRIFGFTALGVHTFELLYLLALGAFEIAVLKPTLRRPWLAAAAPVATVGVYYGAATGWHLTQLEILVAFPLLVSIAAAARAVADTPGRRRVLLAFGAGLAATGVALFKLVLAPVPALACLAAFAISLGSEPWDEVLLGLVVPFGTGVCAGLAAWAAAFWAAGALPQLLWTSFVYPVQLVAEVPAADPHRLLHAALWFARSTAPWLVLGALAPLAWRGLRREVLTVQLWAWVVLGAVAIAIQKVAWWEYHFLLLFVPVGLLAIRGVDGIAALSERPARRFAGLTGLLILTLAALPTVWRGIHRFHARASLAELRNPARLLAWQRASDPRMGAMWQETRFLRKSGARRGTIYVFGNPMYLVLSDRWMAIPVNGWALEELLQEQWDALPGQLARAKPAYVFVAAPYSPFIAQRSPALAAWIARDYQPAAVDSEGTWYQRRDFHVASPRSVAAIGVRDASHAGYRPASEPAASTTTAASARASTRATKKEKRAGSPGKDVRIASR